MDRDQPDRPTRPTARRTAKAPLPCPQRVKLQLTLHSEVKRWIEVQALGTGRTCSEVVTELITAQPAGYTLHKPRATAAEQIDAADQAQAQELRAFAG